MLLLLLLCYYVSSETVMIKVDRFEKIYNYIQSYVQKYKLNTSDILFVSDIDNVLFTYDTDLGTDQWSSWQFDMINEGNNYAITDTINGFINILASISLHKSHILCEDNIPMIINNIKNLEIDTLALTSRSIPLINDTINELHYYNIHFNNRLTFDKIIDNITYTDGIFFTSGKNKGDMLSLLLSQNVMTLPTHIFFVDDHFKHVNDVINVFNNTSINIYGFIYDHQLKRVVEFNKSSKISAMEEWYNIKHRILN